MISHLFNTYTINHYKILFLVSLIVNEGLSLLKSGLIVVEIAWIRRNAP